MSETSGRRLCAKVLSSVTVLGLSTAAPAAAQAGAGTVAGRVVDASGSPLRGVEVSAVESYWSAETGDGGRFRIRLPEGAWRLRFEHLGFAPETLTVEVPITRQNDERLLVTLRRDPIELRGLSVETASTPPMGRTVTKETVRQAPALGEPDVFRAVALLPEASQPNDLTGRIHLAGGASDETGVRLDGYPLVEPFHLLGLQGAFNVAALERAEVSTSFLDSPARDRLSGVIEIETRRARDEAEIEGVLSLLSASSTTTYPDVAGDVDLLASGRLSYADQVVSLLELDAPRIGYHDLLVKAGRSWGDAWSAEGLAYTTRTEFGSGEVRDLRVEDPLQSGERLLGVRVRRNSGAWRLRARAGWNHARVDFDEGPRGPDFIDSDMDWLSGAVQLERRWRTGRLLAGVSVDHRRSELTAMGGERFWDVSMPDSLASSAHITATGLFAEGSAQLGSGVTAEVGGRLLRLGRATHLAPKGRVSVDLSDALTLSGAASRRFQYDAHLTDPPEGTVNPPRFLLDRPRRADVVALSADWRPRDLLGTRPTVRLSGFWKRYASQTRFLAPDSVEGPQPPGAFPVFDRVRGRSFGAAASLKIPIGGEGLVQASYTFERAREIVDDRVFNRDFDLPHRLTLFASLPLPDVWSLNGVFRLRSGPVVTPVESLVLLPAPPGLVSDEPVAVRRLDFGRRNSGRLAPYTRLDLGGRHEFRWLGADWTFFAQVLNATFSRNPREPDLAALIDPGLATDGEEPGLPLMPSFGLEVAW